MPSLNELFSAPGSEAEDDFELDMDKLMQGVDQSIAESTRFRDDEPSQESPAVEASDIVSPSDGPGQEETPADETAAAEELGGAADEEIPQGEALPPASDPLGLLFADAAKDPAKRDRLLQALQDPKPEPTVEQMPEEFAEDSVAARLWKDNQETRAELARIAEGQKDQATAMAKQRAIEAADRAGSEFAARYAGRLDGDDVVKIAQAAGNSGLAARLAAGNDDLKGAYLQALESTLWTEPTLRAKVLDTQTPQEPTQAETDASESKPRKRKLTALSSAASPTSAPSAPKSPLETRTDGKLTPQSRLSVVGELASKLARDRIEGMS